MRHGLRIIDLGGNPVVILPVIVTEHIFIAFITRSKNHQLHVVTAKLIHHTLDQIQALLVCKTGYNTHHKLLLIHRKSQLLLERLFVFRLFLAEILCIIFLGDKRIGLRIKIIIINSVYDSPKTVGPGPHQSIQTFAIKWHLDLLCVGVAYSSDRICINDTAL